jgi:mRNA-degrading endonuclease YafQ of YafQ-DinJ toxin-antitoxin module
VQDILDNFLPNTPLLRVPGKVKKLKGEYAGILQYNVTYSVRVRYFVDEKENIVYVDYIGPHP